MKLIRVIAATLILGNLIACAHKPLQLSNGLTEGNYKVAFVDVKQAPADNILQSKLDDADFQRVRTLLINKLITKLQPIGQGPQIGITIEFKTAKLRHTDSPGIGADLLIWDPATKQMLGSQFVMYNKPHAAALGTNVITALGNAIGNALATETMADEYETQAIDGFVQKVVKTLYPDQKQ